MAFGQVGEKKFRQRLIGCSILIWLLFYCWYRKKYKYVKRDRIFPKHAAGNEDDGPVSSSMDSTDSGFVYGPVSSMDSTDSGFVYGPVSSMDSTDSGFV